MADRFWRKLSMQDGEVLKAGDFLASPSFAYLRNKSSDDNRATGFRRKKRRSFNSAGVTAVIIPAPGCAGLSVERFPTRKRGPDEGIPGL
jgi:hypothetical protein